MMISFVYHEEYINPMEEKLITHQEFVNGYEAGKINVSINKSKAGDFVLSDFADKHNKPAHLFWSWSGILLTIPLPIILIFINWHYSIISFILGLIIVSASRKSASQFVLQNILGDESFFEYVLLHGGAKITDEQDNELKCSFLEKMSKKFGG